MSGPDRPYFEVVGNGQLPSGVLTGATWTAGAVVGSVNTYYTTFLVPGVSPNSVVVATPSSSSVNLTDAVNCPIVTVYCTGNNGGTVHVYVGGNPATPAQFRISWFVSQF
jgi:hypothetical protein